MVNGPRPVIAVPAASPIETTTRATPSRSPLLLQRQHTSIYSACSAETPVLVYGKTATPLAGAWSAEPWQAPMATPQLSAALEEPHDNQTATDTASVADTAAFTDKASEHGSFIRSPVNARVAAFAEALARPTSEQQQQPLEEEEGLEIEDDDRHLVMRYRHDPYSTASRVELYRCDCEACLDAATCGTDALLTGTAGYAHDAQSMGEPFATPEYGYDDNASTATPAATMQGFDGYGESWAHAESEPAAPAAPQPPSAFMPPPPPPKLTRSVMHESAEDNLDVDAAFFHISTRWYRKVQQVQDAFIENGDVCPEPQHDVSFDEWVVEAGKWWLRNFEHRQVKTSASSGLLRSAVAPTHARTTPRVEGFETHTSVSASFANHTTALRTGPRKQRGSSGLTASMLAALAQEAPSMPTPRSMMRPTESSSQQQMPW